MMGRQSNLQQKLFYTKFKLEERIPNKHILRQIAGLVDFDFIYREVKDKYGINGNKKTKGSRLHSWQLY